MCSRASSNVDQWCIGYEEKIDHSVASASFSWKLDYTGIPTTTLAVSKCTLEEGHHYRFGRCYLQQRLRRHHMDRCAQTVISDGGPLRRYAASVHNSLCIADACFDFKAAVLWTADHADIIMKCGTWQILTGENADPIMINVFNK